MTPTTMDQYAQAFIALQGNILVCESSLREGYQKSHAGPQNLGNFWVNCVVELKNMLGLHHHDIPFERPDLYTQKK